MFKSAEHEKRWVVGGFAPTLTFFPDKLLESCPVIGVNEYPTVKKKCDFWLTTDSFKWHDWKPWLKDLKAEKFMRWPNRRDPIEASIPYSAADVWFDMTNQVIPEWDGRLLSSPSSAIAAIHLAIVIGAKEVILAGVDFCGSTRANGTHYDRPDFWEPHLVDLNAAIEQLSKHAVIYKTNIDSPLHCPFFDVSEYMEPMPVGVRQSMDYFQFKAD